jgi:glycosyltransferase 2 family protein
MRPEDLPMIDETGGPTGGGAGRQERPAARSRVQVVLGGTRRIIGSRLVKYGFVAAAIGIGGYEISRQWADIHRSLVRIGPVPSVGALLVLLAAQFAALRVWQVLLAGFGTPLPLSAAGRILCIGQLGKYLPGSIWPILAQMELGAAYRVPRARSASVSVLAMLLSLLTGLVTALVTLPFAANSTQYLWTFLAAPVLVACLHPKVLNPLLRLAFKLAKRPGLEEPLTGRVLAHALAWAFAAWLLNGLQIWLLTVKLGAPLGQAVLLSLGGYAFAWCAGFLVIFAPAGAGIREVLLVATLAPVLGTGAATAVALVSRAVTTASDLIVAGTAAFRRPRGLQRPPETLPAPAAAPMTSQDR